jgi:hypothetical protein
MRPSGAEVKDAAITIAAVGFVGGCVAYALGALFAFALRLEADLVPLATKSGYVTGFGAICWYVYQWTGIAN